MNKANADINKLLRNVGRGQLKTMERRLDALGVNVANDIGYTPLMSASRNLQVEIVALLLKRGADVTARTHDTQSTALHTSVGGSVPKPSKGRPDTGIWQAKCVELLIKNGADAQSLDSGDMTPLMHAAWFGCEKSATVLLKHMNDVNQICKSKGQTAEEIALDRGHLDLAKLIATHGQASSFLSRFRSRFKS